MRRKELPGLPFEGENGPPLGERPLEPSKERKPVAAGMPEEIEDDDCPVCGGSGSCQACERGRRVARLAKNKSREQK